MQMISPNEKINAIANYKSMSFNLEISNPTLSGLKALTCHFIASTCQYTSYLAAFDCINQTTLNYKFKNNKTCLNLFRSYTNILFEKLKFPEPNYFPDFR
jgi:hypothetical protein